MEYFRHFNVCPIAGVPSWWNGVFFRPCVSGVNVGADKVIRTEYVDPICQDTLAFYRLDIWSLGQIFEAARIVPIVEVHIGRSHRDKTDGWCG